MIKAPAKKEPELKRENGHDAFKRGHIDGIKKENRGNHQKDANQNLKTEGSNAHVPHPMAHLWNPYLSSNLNAQFMHPYYGASVNPFHTFMHHPIQPIVNLMNPVFNINIGNNLPNTSPMSASGISSSMHATTQAAADQCQPSPNVSPNS